MQDTVRKPAVAGMFYPDNAAELQAMIDDFLAQAKSIAQSAPKAIIAPHAGYVYSGPVAASAYKSLQSLRDRIQRVVLLGPSHRVAFTGLAAPSVEFFATPLGNIPIDRHAIEEVLALEQVNLLDEAHALEHSLEVHLPFLQETLNDFKLVPLVVGTADAGQVGEVLEKLWGGDETLIVVSSDLSHYHSYTAAQKLDQATTRAIEELRLEDISYEDACGRNPVAGLLHVARRKGCHVETVDLRNSGDTAGPRDQVVGYGAYLLH